MSKLGVNIDHVATVREARKIEYPDPVRAALIIEKAGADSIVCHLREDRRHIQDRDLYALKSKLKIKLNLEMAMAEEIIDIAIDAEPDQITLVPEKRQELTTEGGLDVISQKRRVGNVLRKMDNAGIEVSIFVDPEEKQIKACQDAGVKMIELHTGRYAETGNSVRQKKELEQIKRSAKIATKLGLKVFAGHGLNYRNTRALTGIREIEEYNIGHSIISRAIFIGLDRAVKEMKELIG